MTNNLEIERKFLLNFNILRDKILNNCRPAEIEQVYLNEDPQIRMRRIDANLFTLNIKYGTGLIRTELKGKVSGDFSLLFENKVLRKDRYQIIDNQYKIEVDVYQNPPNLIVAEVEFETEDEAMKYNLPTWFQSYVIREITGLAEYSNLSLFRKL